MYGSRRKIYGETKIADCPFCGKQATTKNPQGIPVCKDHEENELLDMKCICGEYLDLVFGKFGPFFKCMRCGGVTFKKALEYNGMGPQSGPSSGRMNRSSATKSGGSDTDGINDQFKKRFNKNWSYEDYFE
ncbi:MAG: hypothetical protein ACOC32_02535 [Nanoarchaeota archaeon]